MLRYAKLETVCCLQRLIFPALLLGIVASPGLVLSRGHLAAAAPPTAIEAAPAPANRPPHIGPAGREAVMAYRIKNYVPAEMRIGDGYVDGGRSMGLHANDLVTSTREIVTVDRARDAELRKQLAYARSEEVMKLNELDRATRLARRVDRLMTPDEGYDSVDEKTETLANEYRNTEVLLGDVPKLAGGAGVCRHRSLLFKLLADEAGLKASLVRGRHGVEGGHLGSHAWNELRLSDGRLLIVDVMNPQPDFHFPDDQSRQAARYFNQARQPYYPAAVKAAPKPQPAGSK